MSFDDLIQHQIDLAWQLYRRHAGDERAALKRKLAADQKWLCRCCGGLMHGRGTQPTTPCFTYIVSPNSGGSRDDESNIIIVCRSCNQATQPDAESSPKRAIRKAA